MNKRNLLKILGVATVAVFCISVITSAVTAQIRPNDRSNDQSIVNRTILPPIAPEFKGKIGTTYVGSQ